MNEEIQQGDFLVNGGVVRPQAVEDGEEQEEAELDEHQHQRHWPVVRRPSQFPGCQKNRQKKLRIGREDVQGVAQVQDRPYATQEGEALGRCHIFAIGAGAGLKDLLKLVLVRLVGIDVCPFHSDVSSRQAMTRVGILQFSGPAGRGQQRGQVHSDARIRERRAYQCEPDLSRCLLQQVRRPIELRRFARNFL